MASVCKGQLTVRRVPQEADGAVDVSIYRGTVAVTARVVDGSGVPIAFTLAKTTDRSAVFHFAAGEGWAEERLVLAEDLKLSIASAAGSTVELLTWEA